MKRGIVGFLIYLIIVYFSYAQVFTLAVIPDSQYYNYFYYQNRLWNKFPVNLDEILYRQMEYIKDNSVSKNGNIIFAVHLGDIVDHGSTFMEEWLMADKAISILDDNIPFGIVIGNHDYDKEFNKWNGDYNHKNRGLLFNEFFGPKSKHFKDKDWYIDSFDDGLNQCSTFEFEGYKFLFLGLEIEPSNATLEWADKLLKKYKGIPTILAMHTYIKLDSSLNNIKPRNESFGNNATNIWHKLISKNDQIFLVLCGHVCDGNNGETKKIQKKLNGNNVYTLLSDYQSRNTWFERNGVEGNKGFLGDGWMRLLEFDIQNSCIHVKTYSTEFNEYELDENSDFVIDIDFEKRFWK